VKEQRARYLERLEFLATVLTSAGYPAEMPEGGFYLWVAAPGRVGDGWALTEDLARAGGMLVSPGEFYGPAGANFVRVAAVQPMERLRLVASRLAAAGRLGGFRWAGAGGPLAPA
jgi:aspartate/methionine/tyrosine aminotransferase